MCTLAKSEDSDEMQQNAAFHLGLHLGSSDKEIQFYLGIVTPLYIYNGPSQVYCIKPEGRIHLTFRVKHWTQNKYRELKQRLNWLITPLLTINYSRLRIVANQKYTCENKSLAIQYMYKRCFIGFFFKNQDSKGQKYCACPAGRVTIFSRPANTCTCPLKVYAIKNMGVICNMTYKVPYVTAKMIFTQAVS